MLFWSDSHTYKLTDTHQRRHFAGSIPRLTNCVLTARDGAERGTRNAELKMKVDGNHG